MSVELLANVLQGMAQKEAKAVLLPVETGTVVDDMVDGSDVRVKPDGMKVDLSWQNHELLIADDLILRKGDRVIMVGANSGQDYCVLARLTKDPSKAKTGNGSKAVARVGDTVEVTVTVDLNTGQGSGTGTITTGSERVVME